MDQKWIRILAILVFCQKMASRAEDKQVNEGQTVEITCTTPMAPSTRWFRILEKSGVQFLASFDKEGILKGGSLPENFSPEKIKKNILTLKSFKKARDSGIYSCVIVQGNGMQFGQTTRLTGVEVVTRPPQVVTTSPVPPPTTKPCLCKSNNKGEKSTLSCSTIILGPLAGGCGLLLLLLIATTVYCNRTRTRRCPHHYKRKPRMAPAKPMMADRYV